MKRKLGEILLERKLVTPEQLAEALKTQVIYGGRLGTLLVQFGFLRIDDLGRCLSAQHGVPHAAMASLEAATTEARLVVSKELASKHNIIPMSVEDGTLHLAMAHPERRVAGELSFELGTGIQRHVAPELRIKYFLERYYGVARSSQFLRQPEQFRARKPSPPPLEPAAEAPPRPTRESRPEDRRRYLEPTLTWDLDDTPVEDESEIQERMGIVTLEEYHKIQSGQHLPAAGEQMQEAAEDKTPVTALSPLELISLKLETAATGEEIAALLVEPFWEGVSASILFWVKETLAMACQARGIEVAGEDMRRLVISLAARSVLQYAHDQQVLVHGLGEGDPLHSGIAQRVGTLVPEEVCIAPVGLRDSVIGLLYVTSGTDAGFAEGAQQAVMALTRRASRAFLRLVETTSLS